MIYIATSYRTLHVLNRFFSSRLNNLQFCFLILNDIKEKSINIPELESNKLMFFKDGICLENYLIKKWDKNDIFLSFNIFHIFSTSFLKNINFRCANFHPSLLPSYKGVNSINWGLLNNEKIWGCTWHIIDDGIDTGKIIQQRKFNISSKTTQFDLIFYCLMEGLKLIPYVINSIQNESYSYKLTDNVKASLYNSKRKPDIKVITLKDAKKIKNVIPYSKYKAWRWNIKINDLIVTALSDTSSFGDIKLSKTILIDNKLFYYGTTKLG